MSIRIVLAATAALAMTQSASAQTSVGEQCKSLLNKNFSDIEDAPTQLMEAKLVEADGRVPAHCHVKGYVAPSVGFEMQLPVSNWNGKFLKVGCGGFCGITLIAACSGPLQKGYACVASDMGHKGASGMDGKWALNNLQAELDYGFRATHVATLAGKSITEHYYSAAPKKSYYMGCSTGGRQGLVEAQRFPWDFDGLVVGAPAINLPSILMNIHWGSLAVTDRNGNRLFSAADLQLANKAVMDKCDKNDGLADGILEDPRTCSFDPSVLACKEASRSDCLSNEQVIGLQKLYAGPTTSKGEQIYFGAMPGSELNFAGFGDFSFSNDFFRYLAFLPDPGPSWKPGDFDFDRDYKRFGMMEALYSASNPDLRRFKAAGGKMILYHGWNDVGGGGILPLNTLDYYETVERTMGGRAATQEFMRLFMLPGVGHCAGGNGADAVDFLGSLEAWVERGQPPDKLLSAHVEDSSGFSYPYRSFPQDPQQARFTRPVYPYPIQVQYRGKGNPNNAENFRPVKPQGSDGAAGKRAHRIQ